MGLTFKFEGGKELDAALAALPNRVSKQFAREALETAAEPVRRSMQSLAPRAPGKPDIADNMVISTAKGSKTETFVAVGPAKGRFFYGGFLEFGTRFMSARPFVRPAFDGGVNRVIESMKRALWTQLASRGVSRTTTSDTNVESDGPLL